MFSRASTLLLVILLVATFSIPTSALFVGPFEDATGIVYTGLSMGTLKENFMPRFTKGAAGSGSKEKCVALWLLSWIMADRVWQGKLAKSIRDLVPSYGGYICRSQHER